MASIISAGTTDSTSLNISSDRTGILQLASNNAVTAVTIDTSQNVGIGTASPTALTSNKALTINSPTGFGSLVDLKTNETLNLRVFSNATNSGLSVKTATPLLFETNDTTRMAIDSSGNVGIGTTSPGSKLYTQLSSATAYSSGVTGNGLTIYNSSATTNQYVGITLQGEPTTGNGGIATIMGTTTGSGNMDLTFSTRGSATLAERMRIDSSGNVGIGTTSPATNLHVVGQIRTSGSTAQTMYVYGAAGVKPYITINEYGVRSWDVGTGYYSTGTFSIQSNQVNGVYLGGTATSWASASDERLKDIIEPIDNALTKVNGLRSVIGKYKTDEEGVRRSFLIAQDIQTQFPEALESSDSERLGVQYTDVIPLLVASIKELKAINDTQAETINALTARIEALENN